MIVFNLSCKMCNLSFEGWFIDSNDFESQKKRKMVNCPSCNSSRINKALMAPNLNRKSNTKDKKIKKTIASNINKLKKIVEKNFDYVGDKFTEEAKKIKYGETKSYSDIALAIGKPDAVRAVGTAVGANPVSYFVPCHRVIGKSGKVTTGYRWGTDIKEALLAKECAI